MNNEPSTVMEAEIATLQQELVRVKRLLSIEKKTNWQLLVANQTLTIRFTNLAHTSVERELEMSTELKAKQQQIACLKDEIETMRRAAKQASVEFIDEVKRACSIVKDAETKVNKMRKDIEHLREQSNSNDDDESTLSFLRDEKENAAESNCDEDFESVTQCDVMLCTFQI